MTQINFIKPLGPKPFARQIVADKENKAWNYGHLSRQHIALRDAGKGDTSTAIYIRKAMKAILQHDDTAYENAIDEIVKLAGL